MYRIPTTRLSNDHFPTSAYQTTLLPSMADRETFFGSSPEAPSGGEFFRPFLQPERKEKNMPLTPENPPATATPQAIGPLLQDAQAKGLHTHIKSIVEILNVRRQNILQRRNDAQKRVKIAQEELDEISTMVTEAMETNDLSTLEEFTGVLPFAV